MEESRTGCPAFLSKFIVIERLLDVPVTNDKNYYMQVYSTNGSTSAWKYLLRAENTRIGDTFEPNDTSATAKTILKSSTANGTIHKLADVDYYKVSVTNGVLSVRLSTIPSGKDYRFDVYNQNLNLIYETEAYSSSEKKVDIPVSSGYYYVKVYSELGYHLTSKYTLTLSHRSPYTTVSGTIAPVMKPEGGSSARATPIANLPIKIVYTTGTSTTQTVLVSTTTNSAGGFSASFNLPANVKHLYVKVYPEDNTLSVQTLDKNVTAFLYEIPYNAASVSMSVGSSLTDQMRASYSIWKHGKEGIASYKSISGKSASKLIIRCTAGSGEGSSYDSGEDRIVLAGDQTMTDYYDRHVIMHEMGHWEMYHNGGTPSGSGGSHTWSSPSSLPTAYSEGWAHYFSCILRNDSYMKDFNSSNAWYGGNLATGQVKPSYSGSLQYLSSLNPYNDNAKREINVGATLWNLDAELSKNFRDLDTLAGNKSNSFIEYYDKFMGSLSSSQREDAWNIFNSFNVAFDMEVPVVTVSISGLTASMTATDDVAVKRYEWYIDNILKKEGTGSSGSINLSAYGLSAGTHTVECRVYDPEGITTSPSHRPRTQRYGSDNGTFVIANSSANMSPPSAEVNTPSDEPNSKSLPSKPHAPTVSLQPLIDEKLTIESTEDVRIHPASVQTIHMTSPGNSDLHLYLNSSNAVKAYRILTPDGKLYDQFSFIAADTPYIIQNAEAGLWRLEIEGYSQNDSLELLEAQGLDSLEMDPLTAVPTNVSVLVGVSPTKPVVLLPDITSNARILDQYLNSDIDVYENDTLVDLSAKLSDGAHLLAFSRENENGRSERVEKTLFVDTVSPTIELDEFPTATTRNRFVLTAKFSEDIAHFFINDVEYNLGECNRDFFADCIDLSLGINNFTLTLYDYAGNKTTAELSVFREG